MLKKLVKYGNSSALILDKALLELLNIEEGSIVKIKTDGTSLVITAQNTIAREGITKTIVPQETLHEATQQSIAKYCRNEENASSYMNELRGVVVQYGETIKKLSTPEAQQALQKIEQRFNDNHMDPEYIKATLAVRQQYAPELALIDQEVQAISQKYILDEYQYSDKENEGIPFAIMAFKRVHKKYQHLFEHVTKLNDNADYIHESVLLAEKYQSTKNSAEYIKEYVQLVAKYIPEYAHYQEELKKVAESFK